ncbi:HNH endonuclease [Lactococcus phage ASCC465]|uniref:HNH endonuclease n=6 Tax=Skunavirus TaxID=1623305 RepID=H9EFY1_9CAUD|nr:HNH endonuclease [Lactococcus phage ASCC465]YP_008320137.1 HNH endonuclease [Lactococcus phage jm2]YP_009877867.1 HNH endonuclease [Lactococcus phage 05601]AFE86675.1 HNH endonuclease [Lactococcus phage ASCC473]AFE87824.1 HNH endonuclease [Lactococcus phage ASCC497]AFE88055.1 HNH endonuclease [Lactococcus phage ASCC531]AFE86619.1 HNH endonuclease [Lactococcus phage ASCC465]AGI10897.1 putative HNH endonuclease [Lactococcus phage jm2]
MRYKKIDTVIVLENGKVYRELKDRCRLIKGTLRNNGYLQLTIKNKTIKVHRLVIEAFKGKSDLTVDHIDGNKLNNSLDNLQYLTREENLIKSIAIPIYYDNVEYRSTNELSRKLNVSKNTIKYNLNKYGSYKGKKLNY